MSIPKPATQHTFSFPESLQKKLDAVRAYPKIATLKIDNPQAVADLFLFTFKTLLDHGQTHVSPSILRSVSSHAFKVDTDPNARLLWLRKGYEFAIDRGFIRETDGKVELTPEGWERLESRGKKGTKKGVSRTKTAIAILPLYLDLTIQEIAEKVGLLATTLRSSSKFIRARNLLLADAKLNRRLAGSVRQKGGDYEENE